MYLTSHEQFAILTKASLAHQRDRTCVAEVGTVVQVLGRPVSLGEEAPSTLLCVRVAKGPCTGYEITLEECDLAPAPRRSRDG